MVHHLHGCFRTSWRGRWGRSGAQSPCCECSSRLPPRPLWRQGAMWPPMVSPVAAHGWIHTGLPCGSYPYFIVYSLSEQESQRHPVTPQTSPALHFIDTCAHWQVPMLPMLSQSRHARGPPAPLTTTSHRGWGRQSQAERVSRWKYTYNLSGFLISPKTKWQPPLLFPPSRLLLFSIQPTPLCCLAPCQFSCHFPVSPLSARQPLSSCIYFITWCPTLSLWFSSNLSFLLTSLLNL